MGTVSGSVNILITGASGFVGSHCVKLARERGHRVIPLVRTDEGLDPRWQNDPFVTPVVGDLATPEGGAAFTKALESADSVIHAAAALVGDEVKQARDTLIATRAVVDAMISRTGTGKWLVLVSSISVYGYKALKSGSELNESVAIESNPDNRDAYCRNKLAQEQLVQLAEESDGLNAYLMRAGIVYGAGRTWNAHIGHVVGQCLFRFSKNAKLPLTYVENCCSALITAAEQPARGVEIINIVDDDLPRRGAYIELLKQEDWPKTTIAVSWYFLLCVNRALGMIPPLRRRLPGLLRVETLLSRFLPLAYSNSKLKTRLGWEPDISMQEAFLKVQVNGHDT